MEIFFSEEFAITASWLLLGTWFIGAIFIFLALEVSGEQMFRALIPVFVFCFLGIVVTFIKFVLAGGGSISDLGFVVLIFVTVAGVLFVLSGIKHALCSIELPAGVYILVGLLFIPSNTYVGFYYGWPAIFGNEKLPKWYYPSVFVVCSEIFLLVIFAYVLWEHKVRGY